MATILEGVCYNKDNWTIQIKTILFTKKFQLQIILGLFPKKWHNLSQFRYTTPYKEVECRILFVKII